MGRSVFAAPANQSLCEQQIFGVCASSQPILPMRPGIPERQTHDYARHGVTCLFAALNTVTGTVTDACSPRHRHQEFLKFLKKVAAAYPGTDLHVVCDNYSTRKHAEVRAWLARNPRVTVHFTPTGCSWINLVECFFSVITRQAIRRGSFTSVKELTAAIGAFIDHWNDHPRPFAKDADKILASINARRLKQTSLQTTRTGCREALHMAPQLGDDGDDQQELHDKRAPDPEDHGMRWAASRAAGERVPKAEVGA
jgi:transposase